MTAFRAFLATCLVVIVAYSAMTVAAHGWGLLPIFFGDMVAMTWPGQFNLDFFTLLLLSGLWVGWRNRFSGVGVALGVLAIFGGMPFLATYLLILSYQTHGDIGTMMMGANRDRD